MVSVSVSKNNEVQGLGVESLADHCLLGMEQVGYGERNHRRHCGCGSTAAIRIAGAQGRVGLGKT
jgi:hypothetical protein